MIVLLSLAEAGALQLHHTGVDYLLPGSLLDPNLESMDSSHTSVMKSANHISQVRLRSSISRGILLQKAQARLKRNPRASHGQKRIANRGPPAPAVTGSVPEDQPGRGPS